MKEKLILVDGNSLFYKAFYASFYAKGGHKLLDKNDFKDVTNNGVRAFVNMLIELSKQSKKILVAFDHRISNTHRHKYSFYKAGRTKVPIDLYRQLEISKDFLTKYGIFWCEDEKYEADDIIGIVANTAKDFFTIDIYTTDKDLLQLVDKDVSVKLSKKGISQLDIYTIDNFKEKVFGLNPWQIVDLKGIMGDSSDNLKGIHGIGEKGAIKLLSKYVSLENLLKNHFGNEAELISNKINLGSDVAKLSKKLAIIKTEGELKFDIFESIKKKKYDSNELKNWLTNFNLVNIKGKV